MSSLILFNTSKWLHCKVLGYLIKSIKYLTFTILKLLENPMEIYMDERWCRELSRERNAIIANGDTEITKKKGTGIFVLYKELCIKPSTA